MQVCVNCKLKEKVNGSWFCQECKDFKDNNCKCGNSKEPHMGYCRTCCTKRTTKARLEKKNPNKIKIKDYITPLKKELIFFVDYIKQKNCIEFCDINNIFDIYEKLENTGLIEVKKGNRKDISIKSMWIDIKKIYEVEKNDFL